MNPKYIISIILIATLLLVSFPMDTFAKKPQSYEDIKLPKLKWQIPEYSEFQIENGLEGLVVEDDEIPMVYYTIVFPAPPDPEEKVGLAEMTAWTLRNGGSINIPADSLNDIIEFEAAWIGVSTDQEKLRVSGYGHKDDLEFLLGLTRELLVNPAYPEDKIALKHSTMLEKIRRRYDRPNGIAHREIEKLIYPDHPWGRETSEESVNAIQRDDLIAYHKLVINFSDAVIGFSGDFEKDQVKMMTENYFGDLKSDKGEIITLPTVGDQAETGIYYFKKDVSQAFVTMGHQTIDYHDPQRIAAVLMNYILGSGFGSRLTKRIRVDEGLSYSVWSGLWTPVPVKGEFRASAATRLDQAGRTLALMKEVIAEYADNGPTEEEFKEAQQKYVNSYVWKYEDSSDILYRLTYLKWRGLPLDTPQLDLDAYQKLKIEDVRKTAKELLQPDNLVIVVVGDEEKMDRPLKDFGEVFNLKEK
ncbi:MAG: insulinase family protein [Calditrichaeota bacterium]|nr:insulinase family protein [Calditrichota bacterium]